LHGVVFDILVWGESTGSRKRKAPPFGGAFLLSLSSGFGLSTALALLIGVLGLTVRILLLLAGLLAAALLLAGLLTRVLILLARFRVLFARFLVLVGHKISFVERNPRQLRHRRLVSREPRFRCDYCAAVACHDCGGRNPGQKTTPVQAL
jgi:hypothetical protein